VNRINVCEVKFINYYQYFHDKAVNQCSVSSNIEARSS